jgi:hypothetical protein
VCQHSPSTGRRPWENQQEQLQEMAGLRGGGSFDNEAALQLTAACLLTPIGVTWCSTGPGSVLYVCS